MKRRAFVYGGAGVVLAPALFYAFDPFGGPRHRGPRSDHFDGETFHNLPPGPRRGFADFVRWQRTRRPGFWPEWIESAPGSPPEPRVSDLRVTRVGHSTVLVQAAGLNLLTDPVWSDRVSPVSWAGPRRRRAPGIRFEDLPPIDAVLVSHNHYDHLDLPTLERLEAAHRPQFLVSLGNAALLRSRAIGRVAELDWWQRAEIGGARVTAVPARHFSGRGLRDTNATLWCGYAIESAAGTVYFAGDTGWGPHFQQIRERLGAPRLALLPIGAYRPEWFMSPVHMSPREAVEAHGVLGAAASVAIHYGVFAIADDGAAEAVDELARAREPRFLVVEPGIPLEAPAILP
jgi:L-ascorbate metabolism protein UlaG (beta-lactamase superfamily)